MLPPNLFSALSQPPARAWAPAMRLDAPEPEPAPVVLPVGHGWRSSLLVMVVAPLRLARWHHA